MGWFPWLGWFSWLGWFPRLGCPWLGCPWLECRLGYSPLECGLGSRSRLESGLGSPASPFICRLGSELGLGSPLECRLGWTWLLGLALLTPVRSS